MPAWDPLSKHMDKSGLNGRQRSFVMNSLVHGFNLLVMPGGSRPSLWNSSSWLDADKPMASRWILVTRRLFSST